MIIEYGTIVPGERIGEFRIGMEFKKIKSKLGSQYVREERAGGSYAIITENALFNFDIKNKLIQVGVTKGFLGRVGNDIGIGSTMLDVKKEFGDFYEEVGDFLVRKLKGIAFELGDTDDNDSWNELTAPIEWIYIYKID